MTTSGGENPGASGAVSIVEPRQALLEETLSPETRHFAARIQTFSDFFVATSFMSQEDDLCTLYQKIR